MFLEDKLTYKPIREQHSLLSQKKKNFKVNIKTERKNENPDSKLQYNKEI